MWYALSTISYIFKYLPNSLFKLLWRLIDIFDGKAGAILRYILICKRLKQCGEKVYIGSFVHISGINKLMLGNSVSIHHQCTLICNGEIQIGNNVSIAHGCSIISTNHTWDFPDLPIKYNPVTFAKITIEDDVWLGAGVRVLAGTIIKTRCILASGTVLTKDTIVSNAIYGGIPAKMLKKI